MIPGSPAVHCQAAIHRRNTAGMAIIPIGLLRSAPVEALRCHAFGMMAFSILRKLVSRGRSSRPGRPFRMGSVMAME